GESPRQRCASAIRPARARKTGTADSVAAKTYAALALHPEATIASTRRGGGSAATTHTKLATIVVMRRPIAMVVGTSCRSRRNSQNGAAVKTAVRKTPVASASASATPAIASPPAGAGRIHASAGRTPAIQRKGRGGGRVPPRGWG